MRSQYDIVADKEGILHVPGRMVLGEIKGFKIVPIRLYLRSFSDIESQVQEDVTNFLVDLGNRVQRAAGGRSSRQRNINGCIYRNV